MLRDEGLIFDELGFFDRLFALLERFLELRRARSLVGELLFALGEYRTEPPQLLHRETELRFALNEDRVGYVVRRRSDVGWIICDNRRCVLKPLGQRRRRRAM